VIAKKLQATHKTPATFKPKPEKFSVQVVSGALYHYLVKIPGDKYAHVTVAHRAWQKSMYGKEDNVSVRPQLYGLNDKEVQ
jgi:hypothetical protein